MDNESLTRKVAAFRKDSRKEFDKAVAELIAIAFRYRYMGQDFLWEKDPELDAEANRICRELSDTLAERAKAVARAVVAENMDWYDFDEAWDRESDEWAVPILTRFDQQGSFLKELLEVWLAIAFLHSLTQGELRVMVSRYLANPFASPLWKGLPADILAWGRGYSKDLAGQIAVIGQNSIVAAVRFAEWQDAAARGATYYIRRRGSSYNCDVCREMANVPIPIEQPFIVPHSHCMCWPEYHFDETP